MLPTMVLPRGLRVLDVGERVRDALFELERLEANKYALRHWLTTVYQRALLGDREHWPFTLRVTSNVAVTIVAAQRAVAEAREAARTFDGGFIERLPPRVHVVRIRDEWGAEGFGPIDVRGASLTDRGLSLLLADFLMHPEDYADDTRAA